MLERLLLKGSIVVKKAYCDWERYKDFKAPMHEASFELIEIPHVRQSGKNSADIRMVVDALDLCYTKSHVDTFVIISGDSDFSPLVSKLRENAKPVIGVGVKNSTSDLLIANCDEFIYYDDLVRAAKRSRSAARREEAPRDAAPSAASEDDEKQEALDLMLETVEALIAERGEDEKIWGSMVKQALKRRKPGFNESYYGFRSFTDLLEEAREARPGQARARRKVRRLPHPARLAEAGRGRCRAASASATSSAPVCRCSSVGINPGLYSGCDRPPFRPPGNRFWPALHAAGFTPRLLASLGAALAAEQRLRHHQPRRPRDRDRRRVAPGGIHRRPKAARRAKCVATGRGWWRFSAWAPIAMPSALEGDARPAARAFRGRRVWVLPSPSGLNANYQMP